VDRATAGFLRQGKLELLVPPLVIEEFERNRPRSEAAVTKSALTRLRQLRRELNSPARSTSMSGWRKPSSTSRW
jgi:hypothetical protein